MVTVEQAIGNATRLLEWAEAETDLQRLDKLDALAGSWLQVAALINDREHHRET